MIHYPIPPHKQKAYASLYFKDVLFPIANKIAESELSLPIDPFMTNEEVYYIIEKINKFYYGL
jgi:dTDP-4-amino-4,6-dideoxygalactose transaminase